jgi:hypothetical protein
MDVELVIRMKRPALVCALAFCAAMMTSLSANPLSGFQWSHRILLIDAQDSSVKDLRDRLEAQQAAVAERDLLWFIINGENVQTNYEGNLGSSWVDRLVEQGYLNGTEKRVTLIGKDGWVKARSPQLDLEDIFRRIDAMPMRRAEMQERD